MSTPRVLTLPPQARVERWSVRGGFRQVIVHSPPAPRGWVLLVPGFTSSKEDFIGMLAPLASAGFAAVAYDQLGQHESTGAPLESDYALLALADDLLDVHAQAISVLGVNASAHVLGHSFGGLVVQAAAESPRFDASAVTLMCSGPGALPEHRRGLLPALIDALPKAGLEDLWRAKRAWERSAGEPEPPAEIEAFCRDRWLRNDPVGLRAMARTLCETGRVSDALVRRSREGLGVQVVWGEHDDAWPVDVQRALAGEMGAPAVELDGCAHSPNVEDPKRLVEALLAH